MTRKSIGWITIIALCASGFVSVAGATEMTQSTAADTEKKTAPSSKTDDKKSDDKTPSVTTKKTESELTEMEFNTIEVITTGSSDNLCAAIAELKLEREPNRTTR